VTKPAGRDCPSGPSPSIWGDFELPARHKLAGKEPEKVVALVSKKGSSAKSIALLILK
jgi:hypothetical protein